MNADKLVNLTEARNNKIDSLVSAVMNWEEDIYDKIEEAEVAQENLIALLEKQLFVLRNMTNFTRVELVNELA